MSLNYVQGIIQKEETSGDDDLTDSSEEKISQSRYVFIIILANYLLAYLLLRERIHIRYHNDPWEYYVLFTRKKRIVGNRSSQGTKSTEQKTSQANVTLALIPL